MQSFSNEQMSNLVKNLLNKCLQVIRNINVQEIKISNCGDLEYFIYMNI